MATLADHKRDLRLMLFTSAARTYNIVSHARVNQLHWLFLEFEKQYPIEQSLGLNQDSKNHRIFFKEKGFNI